VATEVLAGTPEHAELMEKLERRARENGSLQRFRTALGVELVDDSDGAALQ
jgi:hypothetical protein